MIPFSDIGIDLIVGFVLLIRPGSLRVDEMGDGTTRGARLVGLTLVVLGAFLVWALSGWGPGHATPLVIGINLSAAVLLITMACADRLEAPPIDWPLLWVFAAMLVADSMVEALLT
jgi:hypothetical protein